MSLNVANAPDLSPNLDAPHGREVVDELRSARGICSWCFSEIREYHTGYEALVANHLAQRNAGELTFESRGHAVNGDRELVIGDSPESEADPGTISAHTPPTEIDGERRDGGPATICQCGRIDAPARGEERSVDELFDAVKNIADLLDESDDAPDVDKTDMVVRLGRLTDGGRDNMNDTTVLSRAVDAGLGDTNPGGGSA